MNVTSSTMDAKYKIKKPRLLFEHDPCRMVAFSMDMSSGPRFAASPEDWVVAAGRLSLYGLQESSSHVIFLRLGSIIHPIMPRLRCWRIGRCKFVFPLPTGHHFWRLEIGDENVEVADALADVLSNVLRLELVAVSSLAGCFPRSDQVLQWQGYGPERLLSCTGRCSLGSRAHCVRWQAQDLVCILGGIYRSGHDGS